ncbi:MAG: DUF3883 domain-containing protein [Thermofilaceae archaeon]
MDAWLYLVNQLAENYAKNPFFTIPVSGATPIDPLLHQTELVARALLLNPTRLLVADAIGLGKTVEALRILHALGSYHDVRNVLIVVPATLEKQWIEELRRIGIEPRDTEALKQQVALGERIEDFYVARMDTVKKEEYYPWVSAVAWDAIIVDEAHRLAPRTLRSKIAELAKRNPRSSVILLTATPHRGSDAYYLYLLSAVDPALTPLVPRKKGRPRVLVDSDFYSSTHMVLVHRRIKEDVNKVYEEREVFKPAEILTVLVKPTEEEMKLLNSLVDIGREVVRNFYDLAGRLGARDQGKAKALTALISLLLIKRGSSSPQALVNTFSRIAVKRAVEATAMTSPGAGDLERMQERISELLKRVEAALDPSAEHELDVEPDKVFDEVASALVSTGLLDRGADKLKECLALAERMNRGDLVDSKILFLARLVDLAASQPRPGLEDISGARILVFTEFKDTAYYVHRRLIHELSKRYPNAGDMVRVLTSDNKKEYPEVVKWLEKPGVKVLVATDVMSEGLNLQAANVLVNYEVVYSPVRLEQRVGRVWRYGQRRKVYVFNLFLLNTYEEKIQRILFRKMFSIAETLGKVELGLGEEVYLLTTVYNTLYDGVLRNQEGHGTSDIARYIHAVPVTRLLKKTEGEKEEEKKEARTASWDSAVLSGLLTMSNDDYSKFLDELATGFVQEVVKLAETIRKKRIYPEHADRSRIEEFLQRLTGIRNHAEAAELSNELFELYSDITRDVNKPRDPVETLLTVAARTRSAPLSVNPGAPLFFVVNSEHKRLLVVYRVGVRIGDRSLTDVVGLEADFATRETRVLRGLELVKRLAELYKQSLHVDEVHGKLVEELHEYVDLYSELVKLSVEGDVKKIADYEEAKKRCLEKAGHRFKPLYETRVEHLKPEALAVFFTLGFLPRSKYTSTTGVWLEFERGYLEEVVRRIEKAHGREPEFVHLREHYDVYSRGNGEERYIECKGFTEPKLTITLTQREYATARELGEKYWLYLVYGAGTSNPVVLAIKNPLRKIRFVKEERPVVEVRYTATIG